MEPWRAVDAHNAGLEAQNGARRVWKPVVAYLHEFYEEQDLDSQTHARESCYSYQSQVDFVIARVIFDRAWYFLESDAPMSAK
jgi:hypothetical protein